MVFDHFKRVKDQGKRRKETPFKSHAKFRENGECLMYHFDFLFSAQCTVLVTALVVVGLCLDRILGHGLEFKGPICMGLYLHNTIPYITKYVRSQVLESHGLGLQRPNICEIEI